MATPIHAELKAAAGPNPAAYLSKEFITALTSDRLFNAIDRLKGAEIIVGQKVLSAVLDSVALSRPRGSAKLTKEPSDGPSEIHLALNTDLTFVVNIFVKGDHTKIVSVVKIIISNILIRGSYSLDMITFEGVDYGLVERIDRAQGADKILTDANIDPLEAARVEGLIAYGTLINALSTNLGQKREIPLKDLFPSISFGLAAELIVLEAGEFLGVVPQGQYVFAKPCPCECVKGPDLGLTPGGTAIKVPADPKAGTELGGVTIGGPPPTLRQPRRGSAEA